MCDLGTACSPLPGGGGGGGQDAVWSGQCPQEGIFRELSQEALEFFPNYVVELTCKTEPWGADLGTPASPEKFVKTEGRRLCSPLASFTSVFRSLICAITIDQIQTQVRQSSHLGLNQAIQKCTKIQNSITLLAIVVLENAIIVHVIVTYMTT